MSSLISPRRSARCCSCFSSLGPVVPAAVSVAVSMHSPSIGWRSSDATRVPAGGRARESCSAGRRASGHEARAGRSSALLARAADAVELELVDEGAAGDAEDPGGGGLVARALGQGLDDAGPLAAE